MGHISNTQDAFKFVLGGNSTFTVVNNKSDNRFTFSVRKSKDNDLFFVKVLTGSNAYTYLGTIVNNIYKHGIKSVVSNDAQSTKVFKYILDKLKNDNLPSFIEVWHEGKCGKCGRVLTTPLSISSGFGPECIKSLSKKEKREVKLNLILN